MAVWIVTILAVVLGLVALGGVRRLSRRLESLNQSYWELRYDYTRLRSQVSRLDPSHVEPQDEPQPPASVSFVPLSSIRKKDR